MPENHIPETESADPKLVAYLDGEPASVVELRREKEQGTFPWPSMDNPMLAHLVREAQKYAVSESPDAALVWVAVHCWYEGALAATSLTATDDPPLMSREDIHRIARRLDVTEQTAEKQAKGLQKAWAKNHRATVRGAE